LHEEATNIGEVEAGRASGRKTGSNQNCWGIG